MEVVVVDEAIRGEIREMHAIIESHRETISRLSLETGKMKRRMWKLIYTKYPELRDGSHVLNVATWTISDSE